jgi:hypothetical protein
MKRLSFGLIFLLALSLLPITMQAQNKYVGSKGCIMCHSGDKKGNQASIWQKSKHADAFNALKTQAATDFAKAKGISNPSEAKECLECHTLGKTVDASLLTAGFDISQGVQCETCHDAGSNYKSMSVMKDKPKAIAAGLTEYADVAAIEAKCKTCHNDKSPSFKGFNFVEMYDKIKHKIPR